MVSLGGLINNENIFSICERTVISVCPFLITLSLQRRSERTSVLERKSRAVVL